MMIRRGLLGRKFEKPVTLKTYVNTDVTDSNYKGCNIPIVNNGNYYIYLKLSGYSLAPRTLFNLWNDGLSTTSMVAVEFYQGKIRLDFAGNKVITDSKMPSSTFGYPKTICCTLAFKDGYVYGQIFDESGNSLSDALVLADSFKTPSKFSVYSVVETGYVSKVMITAYDNA